MRLLHEKRNRLPSMLNPFLCARLRRISPSIACIKCSLFWRSTKVTGTVSYLVDH